MRWAPSATLAQLTLPLASGWVSSCETRKEKTMVLWAADATSAVDLAMGFWCDPAGSRTAVSTGPSWWMKAAETVTRRNVGFPSLHPSGFRFILFLWICFDISANLRRHFLSNCTKTHTFTADKLFTPFSKLTKYNVWEQIFHFHFFF